jgi:hypothetical protein
MGTISATPIIVSRSTINMFGVGKIGGPQSSMVKSGIRD